MSQPLLDAVERRLPAAADRAVREYVRRSARYQGRWPEHVREHMAHSCRESARLALRAVREQRSPTGAELELLRERARQRADEGLPVADFVTAYLVNIQMTWEELARAAGGAVPGELGAALLHRMHEIVDAAVQAHQQEYQLVHGEERFAVHEIVQALVAGGSAAELAHRFDVRLADAYGVLAVRLGEHPATGAAADGIGRRIAERRALHRLVAEVHRRLGTRSLTALDPDGGLVLLPSAPESSAHDLRAVREALPRLRAAAGAPIAAAFAHAPTRSALPGAAQQARDLLRLPGRRDDDVAVLPDLLLEYQLSRDSAARSGLTALARELRRRPELAATLDAYLAHDFNRHRTARALHVHPNTVDNRLSRITARTGADPRTARGLLLLAAARTAEPAE
ncbi:PucR family transcriptional regulator [Saccharopolyspora sp. CA-218241]|uniref:PucR family transcriptional regulator n=1 Tax=Saccharopolyspora sp. CA-218241 TaxID=3240027 RepID=UPI003D965957